MTIETKHIDDIECPYCGSKFDGGAATNYDSSNDLDIIECPTCGESMEVFISCEYTAQPLREGKS